MKHVTSLACNLILTINETDSQIFPAGVAVEVEDTVAVLAAKYPGVFVADIQEN